MAARVWKPGCPEWEEDIENSRARKQRKHVFNKVVTEDCRNLPSAQMARLWYQELFDNLVPHSDYLGKFRDVEKTSRCLNGYDVRVDDAVAVPHESVLEEVDTFFEAFRSNVKALDQIWRLRGGAYAVEDIDQVVGLAAWAHGEWVRIHPFANGNGRTARLWANYVFCRYDFGPVVILRPRPGQPYGVFSRISMKSANHEPIRGLFCVLLARSYPESADIMPPF